MFFLRLLFFLISKISLIYIDFIFKRSSISKRQKISNYILTKLENLNLSIFKALNYRINILYDNDNFFSLYEVGKNIFLYTPNTNRFKKILGDTKYKNQAEVIYNLIINETPTIVDIGSYIGEVSIFFAKNKPRSKVFSFEASKKNFNIQKKNINLNNIKNIDLHNKIVDRDNNSFKYISESHGSENFISNQEKRNFSKIGTISLSKISKEYNISHIDYLKIDIENSLHNLTDDIIFLIENKKIGIMNLGFEKTDYENLKKLINFVCKKTEIYKINYADGFLKKISYETFKETLSSKLPSNAGEYLFKVNG